VKLRSLFNSLISLGVLVILVNSLGCTQSRMIQANELNPGSNGKINIYLKNGRTIEFPDDKYTVDTSTSQHVIRGEGTITKNSLVITKRSFSGPVSYSEIDSFQVTKNSPFSEGVGMGIIVIGLLATTALIAMWIFGPISFA
jgi:hypothetical protein